MIKTYLTQFDFLKSKDYMNEVDIFLEEINKLLLKILLIVIVVFITSVVIRWISCK